MQSYIYLIITFVVVTSAKQLKLGPQVFPDTPSATQQQNKRYATQEYKIYFSPDEIKGLQSFKTLHNVENSQFPEEIQLDQQSEAEQLKWYKSQFRAKVPQLGIRGLAAYGENFDDDNSEANIPRGNFGYTNLYPERNPQQKTDVVKSLIEKANSYESKNGWRNVQEDNTKPENDYESAYDIAEKAKIFGNYYWQRQQDDKTKQESGLKNESIQKSQYTVSANNQDNLLNDKLQQQWNLILEHNRSQLKSIQSDASEPQKTKQTEKSAEQSQSRSEIEKEIDNILKSQRDFEFSQQNDDNQEEEGNQRPPILIHREISVTKHLPVPFVKKVKVAVPTPVLIPVPEPFEVQKPRLNSIPIQFLRYLSPER